MSQSPASVSSDVGRGFRTPPPRGSGRERRRGFTLVEILLVLAILAIFSTLFIPGVNSILREINARGPEQIVSELILSARGAALETGRTVTVNYDAETKVFRSDTPAVPAVTLPADLRADLLPVESGAAVLLGGQLEETGRLYRIRFFPDGTCDPFRVRLQEGKEAVRILLADPWTCALSPVPNKP